MVPKVVTYVNELSEMNLSCSNMTTVSTMIIAPSGQLWLGPRGNTVSSTKSYYNLPSANRLDAGNYTCVTKLISNANGLTM